MELYPDTGFVATRLRYGAEQWDMPDPAFDLNDLTALLWKD